MFLRDATFIKCGTPPNCKNNKWYKMGIKLKIFKNILSVNILEKYSSLIESLSLKDDDWKMSKPV